MNWDYLAGFFDGEGYISCRDLDSGWRAISALGTNLADIAAAQWTKITPFEPDFIWHPAEGGGAHEQG